MKTTSLRSSTVYLHVYSYIRSLELNILKDLSLLFPQFSKAESQELPRTMVCIGPKYVTKITKIFFLLISVQIKDYWTIEGKLRAQVICYWEV